MDFHTVLSLLQASQDWKNWHATHEDGFLAYGFVLFDDANKDAWQIGYFCSNIDRMTTFIISPDKISVGPESEVMKDESGVLPLQLTEVKIDDIIAMNCANQARIKSFSAEHPLKIFFILQTLQIGTIYNVTFLTKSLRTLNFKISAQTGEIIAHSAESLVQMDKKK
ncbi:MAG: hypothetical protein Q7K43_03855 [Candidatus Woesearchaeota archaeon]|nr:hypothetical protein [Candidatus Woesearchaeota archaeon]